MKYLIILIAAPFMMAITGCPNAFVESAQKTTDEALLFSAEQHANANEWDAAIADINSMSTGGKAKRETKAALASYYGGACGLNLLDFAKNIKDAGSSMILWPLSLAAQAGATTADFANCKLAESTLLSIDANAANRTPDENIELVFIEIAKMGAALSQSAGGDVNHDGVIDGGFDACSTSSMSDADVAELGSGLMQTANALAASGSTFGSAISGAIGPICTKIEKAPGPPDYGLGLTGFCSNSTAADFTGAALLGLRSLLKSSELGFNTCGGAVGTGSCHCP